MNVGVYPYPHGDPLLIDKIVNEFLSQGKFDKLRKECMSDADTKPAYQNLQQRVESTVTQFLKKQVWKPDLNKNQLRDTLRKHILDSNFFDAGINRIVDQVVSPNVLATVFLPEVEEVVYNYLSIPKPTDKLIKRDASLNDQEGLKPPGSDLKSQTYNESEKLNNKSSKLPENQLEKNSSDEKQRSKNLFNENIGSDSYLEIDTGHIKTEICGDDGINKAPVPPEVQIKAEENEAKTETYRIGNEPGVETKIEPPSDESQESVDRIGVEKLRISEAEASRSVDSDDSMPLEINEKSMSESRDSEDSIMNQMSPISQGRLTPDLPEETEVKSEKGEFLGEDKKALTFIGRIPKIKRNDSESSKKDENSKSEKSDMKNVSSSDESDSSKSYGKSDSDDKKSKEQKKKNKSDHGEEKKRRDDYEKRKGSDEHRKSSRDRDRERKSRREKSKDSKDRDKHRSRRKSREKSRERSRDAKKSSSSSRSSREKSVSHKSSHHSRHRDSKSKDRWRYKKRKEEEKKKSKSADDHGKERNKKDDRRSTDRDSNERDRTSDNRSQEESKKRERDTKAREDKSHRTEKDKPEVEEEVEMIEPASEEVLIEMDGDWEPEGDEIVLVNGEDGWVCSGSRLVPETDAKRLENKISGFSVELKDLVKTGALTRVDFPKMAEDFYVKFNSTGFKYFEEWERTKLDCEEEFKEFVDEAENNLDLISDDGSESDSEEFNFYLEKKQTLNNLSMGLGNFRRSLTFDPATSQFYRWTNNKFYQKFRKKDEKSWKKREKPRESDESIKENIMATEEKEKNKENLAREKKALHLKLLNRLKRRAIRQGKQRRRYRRKASQEGIKEKNENSHENSPFFGPELKMSEETEPSRLSLSGRNENLFKLNLSKRNLIEGESKSPDSHLLDPISSSQSEIESKNCLGNQRSAVAAADDDDKVSGISSREKSINGLNSVDKGGDKTSRGVKESEFKGHHVTTDCHLPPSPESDDCNANTKSSTVVKEQSSNLKRTIRSNTNEDGARERKQPRRSYCQKYDSQDLYKPRPMLSSNRVRARGQHRGDEARETDPHI